MKELELRRKVIETLRGATDINHRNIIRINRYKTERTRFKIPVSICKCCQRTDCKHYSKAASEFIPYTQNDLKLSRESYRKTSYMLEQLQKAWGPDLTNGLKDK